MTTVKKPIRITKYRVDLWLNKATNETMYGVGVKIDGTKGWVRVASDGKPVIYDNRVEAENYITDMKSERDVDGFKIAKAAA